MMKLVLKTCQNLLFQKASELFKNTKVLLRYNEIHDRLVKEAEDDKDLHYTRMVWCRFLCIWLFWLL